MERERKTEYRQFFLYFPFIRFHFFFHSSSFLTSTCKIFLPLLVYIYLFQQNKLYIFPNNTGDVRLRQWNFTAVSGKTFPFPQHLDGHYNLPILDALSFLLQQIIHEANHPSPRNAKLQNGWRYTSTPRFHGVVHKQTCGKFISVSNIFFIPFLFIPSLQTSHIYLFL